VSVLLLAGCASVTDVPVSQPATPSVDLSAFDRVWIAGFLTSAPRDIDLNVETVRLLRSQLKSRTLRRLIDAEPIAIDSESMLRDEERWRELAEEYGAPLIVTGSVKLVSARPVSTERASGRQSHYVLRKGFVLEATFVFIDGRTGEVVASQSPPKETVYGADDRASTLSLYFQLMDRVLPMFLHAFGDEFVAAYIRPYISVDGRSPSLDCKLFMTLALGPSSVLLCWRSTCKSARAGQGSSR
jgi:hypothetical protein